MTDQTILLNNGQLLAKILLPESSNNSRYDQGGIVEQITMNGHTFLSREYDNQGGNGLGGIGLISVFEWQDTSLYDNTALADFFPLPGVGLLKKTDTLPFLFTRSYPVIPFEREITQGEHSVSIHTLPHLCAGVAIDQRKTLKLQKNSLIVEHKLTNVGTSPIHATQFCHNFFQFDGIAVDKNYQLQLPYSIQPLLRRGELILQRASYRLGSFDGPTASTAFWLRGFEGLKQHWMKLTHRDTSLSVLIEDHFPPCRFYSWNNSFAFCPEVFISIDLEPGETLSYERVYTFQTI